MSNLAEKDNKVVAFPISETISNHKEVVVADLENGYTRIANELLDYLGMTEITARQYRVLSSVIRYTFGFQKKTAWITAEKVKNAINYSGNYTHISSDLRELKNRKILIQDGKKIGINTNLSSWRLTKAKKPKTVASTNKKVCDQNQSYMELKTVTNITENGHKMCPEMVTIKEKRKLNKETIKDITHNYVDAENINSNSLPVAKQKKAQIKKPQAFKDFYSLYPAIRKGGNDSTAWKAWKSEKLTEQDAELALKWLKDAMQANSDWGTYSECQYIKGIVKFIRERIWLTPLPIKYQQAVGHSLHVPSYQDVSDGDYCSSFKEVEV